MKNDESFHNHNRLKVLFLISCFGHGRGGHFYSLRTTAEELRNNLNATVVSVGHARSPVLDSLTAMGIDYVHVNARVPNPASIVRLFRICRATNTDVVHSFDSTAYFFARMISLFGRVPVIHTKCGGPSPGKYYPKARDLVLFSTEDMCWFSQSKRHKRSQLHHIPNRVGSIEQDRPAITDLQESLDADAVSFLRIARFSKSHRRSIVSSVNLIKRLMAEGLNSQLVLIGAVQDQEVRDEIANLSDVSVTVFDSDSYTVNASRLLNSADFVIGTGRGAMEALSIGKPVLAPTKDSELPVLIDAGNISHFLDFNFSDRTPWNLDAASFKTLLWAISDTSFRKDLTTATTEFAHKSFLVSGVVGKYVQLYRNATPAAWHVFDIALHWYLVRKTMVAKLKHYGMKHQQ